MPGVDSIIDPPFGSHLRVGRRAAAHDPAAGANRYVDPRLRITSLLCLASAGVTVGGGAVVLGGDIDAMALLGLEARRGRRSGRGDTGSAAAVATAEAMSRFLFMFPSELCPRPNPRIGGRESSSPRPSMEMPINHTVDVCSSLSPRRRYLTHLMKPAHRFDERTAFPTLTPLWQAFDQIRKAELWRVLLAAGSDFVLFVQCMYWLRHDVWRPLELRVLLDIVGTPYPHLERLGLGWQHIVDLILAAPLSLVLVGIGVLSFLFFIVVDNAVEAQAPR